MEQVMEQKQTKKLTQDELNAISQFRNHMQEKVMQYGELELECEIQIYGENGEVEEANYDTLTFDDE